MNQPMQKKEFAPFENDHQSMQIGDLIFENQTDKVIVYGDIDITRTQTGLEQALRLQNVFNEIVVQLQKANAEGELQSKDSQLGTKQSNVSAQIESSKEVDNPFS